jgi:phosphoglucomutase
MKMSPLSVPEQCVAVGTSGHRGSSFDKAFNECPSVPEGIYKSYAESVRGADHLRSILEEAQAMVPDALAARPDRSDKS